MAYRFLGADPLEVQVNAVLAELVAGRRPSDIERLSVDIKEETGRRGARGAILPGAPENEEAADYLAGEMACFANTVGGGAIILGVADDGLRIGTDLDAQWLRHRIYELTERKLTVDVREADLDGTRVLVLRAAPALEPIRHHGRLTWRVDDNCVEIDAASWAAAHLYRSGFDWSGEVSGHELNEVSPIALELARRYLREEKSNRGASELASAEDADLLRRLNVLTADGHLTNAGSLLFVTTPSVAIDYIRREYSGGDSTTRVERPGPLIEQLAAVEQAAAASNRTIHRRTGFVEAQIQAIPPSALREAVVNGITHRDWHVDTPTTVEHVGDTLVVTSPGGFVPGVAPDNIITHPSAPRYRSLAQAMASLRLAEREGIGVDRMIGEMLALGHPRPDIAEVAGPFIRLVLVGGDPDGDWMDFLSSFDPETAAHNLDVLLILEHLLRLGWVDAERAAPVLQRSSTESAGVLGHLAEVTFQGAPLVVPVDGVPPTEPPAFRLSDPVRSRLATRLKPLTLPAGRREVILTWARERGRVSSPEVKDLTAVSSVYAGTLLKDLATEGLLEGSSTAKRGRGYFYRPIGPTIA